MIGAGIIIGGVLIFTGVKSSARTLKVYNAGEYIDPDLLKEFEKQEDCKVIYETFDSNESMYTKIQSGAEYDILIPSDYMIERLIKEDQLQKVDWSKISNKEALNPEIMGFSFDPKNDYTVPYFAGTVGILYDKTVVSPEDLQDGWNLLCNTKYKGNIYMYDSERDSFMVALKALNYSMNTESEKEIEEAYQWLIHQRDSMDVVYAGDDVIDNMISGNKALAVVYSGDAAYIMQSNPNMEYFEPSQGTNEWCDGMVITKDCEDKELAEKFMDFMTSYDAAYANSSYVGYTSCVKKVQEDLKKTDFEGVSAYSPDFGYEKNEVFGYQEMKLKQKYADLWTKVKAY